MEKTIAEHIRQLELMLELAVYGGNYKAEILLRELIEHYKS